MKNLKNHINTVVDCSTVFAHRCLHLNWAVIEQIEKILNYAKEEQYATCYAKLDLFLWEYNHYLSDLQMKYRKDINVDILFDSIETLYKALDLERVYNGLKDKEFFPF